MSIKGATLILCCSTNESNILICPARTGVSVSLSSAYLAFLGKLEVAWESHGHRVLCFLSLACLRLKLSKCDMRWGQTRNMGWNGKTDLQEIKAGFSEALLSPPASLLLHLDALALSFQVNFSHLQKDLNISCIHSIASKCVIPETINELSQTLRSTEAEDVKCLLMHQKIIAKHGSWILSSWGPRWCLLPQPWGVLHLLQRCPDVSPFDGAWVTAWNGW